MFGCSSPDISNEILINQQIQLETNNCSFNCLVLRNGHSRFQVNSAHLIIWNNLPPISEPASWGIDSINGSRLDKYNFRLWRYNWPFCAAAVRYSFLELPGRYYYAQINDCGRDQVSRKRSLLLTMRGPSSNESMFLSEISWLPNDVIFYGSPNASAIAAKEISLRINDTLNLRCRMKGQLLLDYERSYSESEVGITISKSEESIFLSLDGLGESFSFQNAVTPNGELASTYSSSSSGAQGLTASLRLNPFRFSSRRFASGVRADGSSWETGYDAVSSNCIRTK